MSGKLVMVSWPGSLNHEYGFNPAKKDISSIKNHDYIYYFDMNFTRDKPVLSPFNTKVDDPNPFIWQKMNPFKADEPLSSMFMIDTPPLQIYGR